MDFQKKSTKVLVSVIAIIAILAVGLGIKYYKSLNDMSVGKFIIDKKNCYIYYYQTLGDEKPELLAKAYFGDDKKVEYVDIKDKN